MNETKIARLPAHNGAAVLNPTSTTFLPLAPQTEATLQLLTPGTGEDGVYYPPVSLYLNTLDTRALYDLLHGFYGAQG